MKIKKDQFILARVNLHSVRFCFPTVPVNLVSTEFFYLMTQKFLVIVLDSAKDFLVVCKKWQPRSAKTLDDVKKMKIL